MSGGHYQYQFFTVRDFANQLEKDILTNDVIYNVATAWEFSHNHKPETIDKLKTILNMSSLVAELMREAEWLYSGDTNDESFSERVKKIVQLEEHQFDLDNLK